MINKMSEILSQNQQSLDKIKQQNRKFFIIIFTTFKRLIIRIIVKV